MEITNSQKAVALMQSYFSTLDHEECHAIYLTAASTVIDKAMITAGSLDQTIMDTRRIVKNALLNNAKAIILLHNHVSGEPKPSTADIKATAQLHDALALFDINLVDHIVSGKTSYYSFADEETHTFLDKMYSTPQPHYSEYG